MSNLLPERWVAGEAADRGITVSDTEIQTAQQIKQNSSAARQAVREVARSRRASREAAGERIRLQLIILEQNLQKAVVGADAAERLPGRRSRTSTTPTWPSSQQPETRDVRVILNKDRARSTRRWRSCEKDDSAPTGRRSATKYSTDEATKSNGGLRQGVAKGQSEPALDDADLLRVPPASSWGRSRARPATT